MILFFGLSNGLPVTKQADASQPDPSWNVPYVKEFISFRACWSARGQGHAQHPPILVGKIGRCVAGESSVNGLKSFNNKLEDFGAIFGTNFGRNFA